MVGNPVPCPYTPKEVRFVSSYNKSTLESYKYKFKQEEGSLVVRLKDVPLGNYWLEFSYFSGEVTKTSAD
jgi:hypothetical protein